MRAARHGWIIDRDLICEESGYELTDRFGTVGPRNISQKVQDLRLLRGDQVARRWRALDSDGNVYYEGRYVGPDDERMFSPLEDFAKPDAGATTIEYLNAETESWEEL